MTRPPMPPSVKRWSTRWSMPTTKACLASALCAGHPQVPRDSTLVLIGLGA
jgi:hypothetical protein